MAGNPPAGRRLTAWAHDVYSQNGEDGMVAEALRRLGIDRGTCVEVGAHDGFTNANTARLWHDLGWTGLLVEPDAGRHAQLVERSAGHDCTVVHGWVRADGQDRLDHHLERAGMAPSIDVLSIDVDGDDLAILRSLEPTAVRARVLVCEYNPTIPWSMRLEGRPGTPTGCSLGTLLDAAEAQGYLLVGVTATNGVFVHSAGAAFDDVMTDVAVIAVTDGYTFVLSDYAGRSEVVGPMPYPFRPGRPAFDRAIGRSDVRVRWTLRGALGTVVSATRNARRDGAGQPLRRKVRLLVDRLRR